MHGIEVAPLHRPAAVSPMDDFNGTWLCTEIEGDMGAVLIAMGVPFLKRKAAAIASYGRGMLRMDSGLEPTRVALTSARIS